MGCKLSRDQVQHPGGQGNRPWVPESIPDRICFERPIPSNALPNSQPGHDTQHPGAQSIRDDPNDDPGQPQHLTEPNDAPNTVRPGHEPQSPGAQSASEQRQNTQRLAVPDTHNQLDGTVQRPGHEPQSPGHESQSPGRQSMIGHGSSDERMDRQQQPRQLTMSNSEPHGAERPRGGRTESPPCRSPRSDGDPVRPTDGAPIATPASAPGAIDTPIQDGAAPTIRGREGRQVVRESSHRRRDRSDGDADSISSEALIAMDVDIDRLTRIFVGAASSSRSHDDGGAVARLAASGGIFRRGRSASENIDYVATPSRAFDDAARAEHPCEENRGSVEAAPSHRATASSGAFDGFARTSEGRIDQRIDGYAAEYRDVITGSWLSPEFDGITRKPDGVGPNVGGYAAENAWYVNAIASPWRACGSHSVNQDVGGQAAENAPMHRSTGDLAAADAAWHAGIVASRALEPIVPQRYRDTLQGISDAAISAQARELERLRRAHDARRSSREGSETVTRRGGVPDTITFRGARSSSSVESTPFLEPQYYLAMREPTGAYSKPVTCAYCASNLFTALTSAHFYCQICNSRNSLL